MKTITIHFSLHLPAKLRRKKKWFLASCPILDVHSQGETEEQAKKNLAEALTLFFISCHERGTLDAVLKEYGFTPIQPSVYEKTPTISGIEYIDVPIPFYVNMNNRQRCHA
ncbi:MAG: hypothetical protein COW04_02865 [Deltaproteobacteria bacterium CG12_big_fil_rev_8_21_14_0_65_43_10]|nr:MAG: hypothetical protein COW04_02865 [Deltaproteobacteria bacterium CG12_big_fil_rev_8_21_14_0_65_43_10]